MTDPHGELILRDYQERDRDAVIALKKLVFPHLDVAQEVRRWAWEFDANPARPDAFPKVWIMESQGRVVGSYGHIPLTMALPERDLFGICGTDFCLDPSLQGRGIGQAFIRHFLDPRLCEFPFFVLPTEVTLHLMQKYGAILVDGNLERCLWVFYCNALDPLAGKAAPPVEEVSEFDVRFDLLFAQVRGRFGLTVKKDRRYLDWRYSQFPFAASRVFTLTRSTGALAGMAVFQADRRANRAYVMEWLLEPDDTDGGAAMLSACIDAARAAKVAELYTIQRLVPLQAILERRGFHCVQRHMIRFGCRWSFRDRSPSDWCLVPGDGDLLYAVADAAPEG